MGGAEKISVMLAAEAAKNGYYDSVEIFVMCWNKTGTLDELNLINNIKITYANAPTIFRGVLKVYSPLVKCRYSLIFSSIVYINAFTSLLRRLRLVKVDQLIARESTEVFRRVTGLKFALAHFLYFFYGHHDLVVCQTESMLSSLEERLHKKAKKTLCKLDNPIDIKSILNKKQDDIPPEIKSIPLNRNKIIWCGKLEPIKYPSLAIDVLYHLNRNSTQEWHLIMVGDGSQREQIAQQAKDHGVQNFLSLTGYQENPICIMAKADVGLVTSIVEGFPNVILEMLASGVKKLVTTNCSGGLTNLCGIAVSEAYSPSVIAREVVNCHSLINHECVNKLIKERSPSAYFRKMLHLASAKLQ